MKRFQLLLLLIFLASTLSAQNRSVEREVGEDYVKITKIIPNWAEKHDLRIGLGSVSLLSMMYLDADFFGMVDYNVIEQDLMTVLRRQIGIVRRSTLRELYRLAMPISCVVGCSWAVR